MHLLPWEKGPKTESSIDTNLMGRMPNLNNKWAFLGQVGYNILVLVFIAMLFGLNQQFSEYLEGRGEQRDRERDSQDERQRDMLCELIADLPAAPGSNLYSLNDRLGCTTSPRLVDPGEVPDSATPTTSTGGGSTGTGNTQQDGDGGDAGAAGTGAAPAPTTGSNGGGGATTVPTPSTPTRTTTAPPRPTQSQAPAPTPAPTSQPPADPGQDAGGIVPGVDVLLCLPGIGCVLV